MQECENKLLEQAVELLKNGEVIGLPTETVYGLAAKISDESAIRKIFATKGRPFFDPLIVHVASIEQAKGLVNEWPSSAQKLAETFWPGPLTMVLPKNEKVSNLITSGLETVAIRCPRHPVALKLIEELGEPVAAPSANKFGRTSPSKAKHVIDEFEGNVFVLEGGACEVGIESTIIKLVENPSSIEVTLLRAGSIGPEEINLALQALGKTIHFHQPGTNIEAPGQVKHHYMPTIPLLTIEKNIWNNFIGASPEDKLQELNKKLQTLFQHPYLLKLNSNPAQAARELYSTLRSGSTPPHDLIIFIKEESHQGKFWMAIMDRIHRASTYHLY